MAGRHDRSSRLSAPASRMRSGRVDAPASRPAPAIAAPEPGSVDVLSDVLRTVRLTGAVFFPMDASSPWVDEVPAAAELRRSCCLARNTSCRITSSGEADAGPRSAVRRR